MRAHFRLFRAHGLNAAHENGRHSLQSVRLRPDLRLRWSVRLLLIAGRVVLNGLNGSLDPANWMSGAFCPELSQLRHHFDGTGCSRRCPPDATIAFVSRSRGVLPGPLGHPGGKGRGDRGNFCLGRIFNLCDEASIPLLPVFSMV